MCSAPSPSAATAHAGTPSPSAATAHAGKAAGTTPTPSPAAARFQPTLSKFFQVKGAPGPRPAVAPPPVPAGSAQPATKEEGAHGAKNPNEQGAHGAERPTKVTVHAGGSQGNAAAAPAAELRGTARGGSLIPSSFVSFCEDPTHRGGFTPVYEPADGCSYSAYASMSSVNAGAFRLYVGGAAINRSFLAPFHSETAAGSASRRPFFCPPPFCPPCAAFLS